MHRLFIRKTLSVLLVCGMLAAIVPVGAQGDEPVTHVVQPGENLFRIALRYNISVTGLMAANGLTDPDTVLVGYQLVIPGVFTTSPAQDPGAAQVVAILGPEQLGVAAPETAVGAENPTELAATAADPSLRTADLGIIAGPAGSAPAPVRYTSLNPAAAQWLFDLGAISLGDERMREVYAQGQALGNNPHAFAKVGDCNSEPPFFLAKFDLGEYHLGEYGYLQPVIDQFAGSFFRKSAAVWTGNHAWALFDPVWSNPATCYFGETPLECEFRAQRPSFVLVRLGTNEAGQTPMFEPYMRQIIEFAIAHGTIPILGTKADRLEGSDQHNTIVRALAAEYGVPLWDFSRAVDTIPGRGLQADGFHLTYAAPYFDNPLALQTGHALHNLTALVALEAVWQSVTGPEPVSEPE